MVFRFFFSKFFRMTRNLETLQPRLFKSILFATAQTKIYAAFFRRAKLYAGILRFMRKFYGFFLELGKCL